MQKLHLKDFCLKLMQMNTGCIRMIFNILCLFLSKFFVGDFESNNFDHWLLLNLIDKQKFDTIVLSLCLGSF